MQCIPHDEDRALHPQLSSLQNVQLPKVTEASFASRACTLLNPASPFAPLLCDFLRSYHTPGLRQCRVLDVELSIDGAGKVPAPIRKFWLPMSKKLWLLLREGIFQRWKSCSLNLRLDFSLVN